MPTTPNTYAQAAADARLVLRGFKAFAECADALDKAAGLEQHVAELTTSVSRLTEQRDALQVEVSGAQHAIEAAKNEAQRIMGDAAAAAQKLVDDAKPEAERIRIQAGEEAEKAKAAAKQELDQAVAQRDEAVDARDAARIETEALEKRAADARTYLATLKA